MEKTHFVGSTDTTEYIDQFYDINGDTLIMDGKGYRRTYSILQKKKIYCKI